MTSVSRPQAVRSQEAILRAVVELIHEEGAAAVTHQRVAQRAGVGRATVYRHWPQPFDLMFAALEQTSLRFLEPAPGTFSERVRADLERVAAELNDPQLMSLAATLIERAQWDPAARELRDRLVGDVLANIEVAAAEAVQRGELRAAPAADLLLDALLGPFWGRRLVLGRPITPELIDQTLRQALAPWEPSSR